MAIWIMTLQKYSMQTKYYVLALKLEKIKLLHENYAVKKNSITTKNFNL